MTSFLPHLVESTLFAVIVWLTTLALRPNRARTRHALWMAASVKFLLPFSLFVALGSHMITHAVTPAPVPELRFVMADGAPAIPLSALPKTVRPAAPVRRDWRAPVLWLLWVCGCAGILIRWSIRWHAASVNLRESTPWNPPPGFRWLPARTHSSASVLEPGVFGVFRPVLVLPAGIEEHLSPEQMHSVLAHELCHIRHRDNLAAAIHMLVEALFWFHPLVWWMGARLVDERERACDEEVLELGSDRAVYAESILRVCRFYLESPVPCVSGITGADLKQRVRNIMTASARQPLDRGRKLLLAAMGVAAVAMPLGIGLTHPSDMRAQAAPQTARPLQFDAASVKASSQSFLMIMPQRSGGRITWTTDLWYLLGYAYRLQPWRISGPVPGSDHIYSVEAVTDPNATEDQVRLMFQSLLVERFQMAVHRETKDVDGYALTVAKSGLKMVEAKDGEQPPALPAGFRSQDAAVLEGKVVATIPAPGAGAITGRRATMLQLAEALQRVLRVAVVDRTSLNGKYYFAFQFAQENHPPETDIPELFAAVDELGLRLEKHKGPVEMLVVDHIEKIPTEN